MRLIIKTQVIIVAAGIGSRLKLKTPKALVVLHRKPMVWWSLKVFEQCSLIDGVIIVGHKDYLDQFKTIAKSFAKVKAVVAGGLMRADSVRNGLKVVDDSTRFVLVHDAARPLIDEQSIRRLLEALKTYKGAILALPVKPTIKMVNAKSMCVTNTLPRSLLWEAQTPQGFDKNVLIKAHNQKLKEEATDDAMLVENMGIKVKVVLGSARNIKITTSQDLVLAGKTV